MYCTSMYIVQCTGKSWNFENTIKTHIRFSSLGLFFGIRISDWKILLVINSDRNYGWNLEMGKERNNPHIRCAKKFYNESAMINIIENIFDIEIITIGVTTPQKRNITEDFLDFNFHGSKWYNYATFVVGLKA